MQSGGARLLVGDTCRAAQEPITALRVEVDPVLPVHARTLYNTTHQSNSRGTAVADPGFSPGGAPTPKIAIIFHIFAENCMKMKEFGPPGGGARPWRPPPWIRQ